MNTNSQLHIIIFVFLLWPTTLFSQKAIDKKYTYTIGANVFKGFVIKHDNLMGQLSQGITNGFELNINKNTYGHQLWEQAFKYPDIGFSLSYFDYGNDWLGESIGALAYSDFILHRSDQLQLLFKIGTGAGYHSKPYDKKENNKNLALGTKFSFYLQTRLGLNVRLTEHLKLTPSVTISHFSAAAFSQPNKGLNIVSANAGIAYRLDNEPPSYQYQPDLLTYDSAFRLHIHFAYSVKEIEPIGTQKFPVYVLSAYVNKQISRTNIINVGLDAFANTSLREKMRNDERFSSPEEYPDYRRIGLTLGHELKLKQFGFLTQMGIYLYRPYKKDKAIYQRYSLKYYFDKLVYASVGFTSHFAKADFSEWALGIRF